MKKQTVKRRIFISNAFMILVTFIFVFLINLGVVKLYWELIEHKWEMSMETMVATANVGDLLEEWTVHQRSFYVLFLADILVCVGVWILVSMFFTGRLVQQIMKPLEVLGQGAIPVLMANIAARLLSAFYNYSMNCRFVFCTSRQFHTAVDYFMLAGSRFADSRYFCIVCLGDQL